MKSRATTPAHAGPLVYGVVCRFACLAMLFAFVAAAPHTASAQQACDGSAAAGNIQVFNTVSADTMYVSNKATGSQANDIFAQYTGIDVATAGATTYTDIWVQIPAASFAAAGGNPVTISLGGNEDGYLRLGPVDNTPQPAYLYVQNSQEADVVYTQTYDFEIYDGDPRLGGTLLCTYTKSVFEIVLSQEANANKVDNITVSTTDPIVGSEFTITVNGQTGTIGANRANVWTPATRTGWLPDAFQLVSVFVDLTSRSGQTCGATIATLDDELVYRPAAEVPSACYTATYTFRAVGTTGTTTTAQPIVFISSGTQEKHTNPTSSSITIQPADNDMVLAKSANTDEINYDNGESTTVTYYLDLTNNNTTRDAIVTDFIDSLPTSPATPTYVANSSTYDDGTGAVAIGDPDQVDANTLQWEGPFDVPASTTTRLSFQVTYPQTNGTYINNAIARVEDTQIDQTAPTDDDVPASHSLGVLPVELTSFEALVDGPEALLRWETASETNNAGFDVELRRPDAEAFERLGFVEGYGTTTQARRYAYRVADLTPGRHVFRLRQVDFDGAFAYSPEVEVVVGLTASHVVERAYPNPFRASSTVRVAVDRQQAVRVVLYDVLGREVATLHAGVVPAGQVTPVRIDGAGLASGLYLLRVEGERFVETQQVTLLR